MVICSSEVRHHVALSPHEEDRLVRWDVLWQVKALRKSPLLAPLRGAPTRRSPQARIASAPGQSTAGAACVEEGEAGGVREKDSDSRFYFNSSTGCFYAGWRATVVRPLRVIRLSRPARRKRGSLGEYRELAGRVCQHHHPRFWTSHHDRTHKRYDLFFLAGSTWSITECLGRV